MENFGPQIFTAVINFYLPEPQASLMNGMLFGIDLKTSKLFYEQLKAVGLLHIVVLSGMNITLLGSIILGLFTYFGRKLSGLITILFLIFFVIFVGAEAPIVRAGFMGILTLVAFLYGRRNFAFFALFISLIFIFIFWPEWMSTISLQLSYGATLGILLFGKTNDTKDVHWFKKFIHGCKNNIKISLAAQIFTAPLIFIHFKQISLISPVSNLFVSFLIGPLTLFGLIAAVLGKIHYSLGLIPAYICYGLLSYMIFVIETLSKIPFAYFNFK